MTACEPGLASLSHRSGDAEAPRRDEALRSLLLDQVVRGTFSAVGPEFFRLLVCLLAQTLGVRYALVSECTDPPGDEPSRVRTLGFWVGREFGAECEYELRGTPCAGVLQDRTCVFHPDDVAAHFPADAMLAELGARSYLGLPLQSSTGRTLGHLAILHDRPLTNAEECRGLLAVLALRAGPELERLQAERDQKRLLTRLLLERSRAPDSPGLISICAWCRRIRESGDWLQVEGYLLRKQLGNATHGICPACAQAAQSGTGVR